MTLHPPLSRLNAAVIGLGVGEQHALAYARNDQVKLAALCDTNPQVLAQVGQKFPDAIQTTRPEDILHDPQIRLVSIASYDDAHAGQILAAIQHQKHVFAEKPLCLSHDEAVAIAAALKQNPQVRLGSNLVLRACPRFLRLREMIQAGELGEIYYAEGDYLYGRLEKLTHGWRGATAFYSVMLGGGVHLVDLLQWLVGQNITTVQAAGNRLASGDGQNRCDDFMVSLARFEGGALAKLSANFGCVHPHFHALAVYGAKATFINTPQHGLLYTSRDKTAPPVVLDDPYPGAAKGALIPAFVGSVLGAGPPPVTETEVFSSLAVCLAMDRASQTGACEPVLPIV